LAPKKLLHQADAVFRGFRYQLLQSLLTWLSLREGEELCIEISEDFSRASSDAITDVQVKSSTAKDLPRYSLQTGDVKAALLRYWERSGGGLDPLPQLVFLAHGGEAKEQGLPLLPGGLSGIGYWRAAAADADVGPMRALLLAVFADTPIGAWLGSEPSDQELRDRLLRRVTWALNAPSARARPDHRILFVEKNAVVECPDGNCRSVE
jgi:hypothetical protein